MLDETTCPVCGAVATRGATTTAKPYDYSPFTCQEGKCHAHFFKEDKCLWHEGARYLWHGSGEMLCEGRHLVVSGPWPNPSLWLTEFEVCELTGKHYSDLPDEGKQKLALVALREHLRRA